MADPTSLYRFLPDVYSRKTDSDLYKLLSGLAEGMAGVKAELADFKDDITFARGTGQGLDWKGESYGIPRSPGMVDDTYRNICLKMAGMRRCTIAAIKVVLETATGLTWTVEDKQLNASVPAGEVWCTPSGGFLKSYGAGMYPPTDANISGDPIESSVAGPITEKYGELGGTYNDHAWGSIDPWTQALVEKVKGAGIRIVYKGT